MKWAQTSELDNRCVPNVVESKSSTNHASPASLLVSEITSSLRFTHAPLVWCCTIGTGLDYDQSLSALHLPNIWQRANDQGNLFERYWYGAEGMGVKKTSGNTTTYSFFAQYEEEVTNGVTTAISHYSFGGLRIAVKRGNTLYHLHGDHLGSTLLTTDGAGAATASRAYYAYGAERSSSGDLQTDRTFTGQKRDATGLM